MRGDRIAKNYRRVECGRKILLRDGKLKEDEILGECSLPFNPDEYLSFRRAVGAVRHNQPEKPTPFINELYIALFKAVYPKNNTPNKRVKVFTAINSALDICHQVDAFVEIRYHPKEHPVRITFDLTTNPKKQKSKADLILKLPKENLKSNRKKYFEFIELAKQKILEIADHKRKNKDFAFKKRTANKRNRKPKILTI